MRTCNYCKSEILSKDRRAIYCSRRCSATHTQRNGGNRGRAASPQRRAFKCLECGAGWPDGKHFSSGAKYCGAECALVNRKKGYRAQLVSTLKETGELPAGRRAKAYLLETRGHCCEICNRKTWSDAHNRKTSIPLVMDHIDGNSTNNALENLRLVCGNCDMLLPTYKNKNRGNGRHSRRKRYAAGKSY